MTRGRPLHLAKSSALTLAATVTNFGVGVVVSIVLARGLGPAGRGEYALLTLTATVVFLLANLGVGQAIVYHIGRGRDRAEAVLACAFVAALVQGLAAVGLFWVGYAVLRDAVFAEVTPTFLWVLVSLTPITLLVFFLQQVLVGKERFVEYSAITVLLAVTTCGLYLAFLIVLRLGVFGAVATSVVGSLLSLAAYLVVMIRLIPWRPAFDVGLLRRLAAFGVQGQIGTLAIFLAYRVDTFLVSFFLGLPAVGQYAVAVALAESLLMLGNSVSLVLFPRASALSHEAAGELAPLVSRSAVFLAGGGALFLALLGEPLVGLLYGPAFVAAVTPMRLLLPGMLLLTASKVLSAYIVGRGRPLITSLGAVPSLAANVLLNLLLIPRLGLGGAALASTAAYGVSFAVAVSIFVRMSKRGVWEAVLVRPEDLTLYARAVAGFIHRGAPRHAAAPRCPIDG